MRGKGHCIHHVLEEGRENEIAPMLTTPLRRLQELRKKLYQKAKQENGLKLRKPLEEDDWKAVFGKTERTVVRPAKAGVFSRSQSCYVKSQKTYSLDSKVAGNQDFEAYRQRYQRVAASCQAVTKVNVVVASKVLSPEGRTYNRRVKAAWIHRKLTDTGISLQRGENDGMTARTHVSNWRNPHRPDEKSSEQGKSYNQKREMD